jgi:hypothetical protein
MDKTRYTRKRQPDQTFGAAPAPVTPNLRVDSGCRRALCRFGVSICCWTVNKVQSMGELCPIRPTRRTALHSCNSK